MAEPVYIYLGHQIRVYPAYLAVNLDGQLATLVGIPNSGPVVIRRSDDDLPPVPDDGMWTIPDNPKTNVKTKKMVT